jgi:1-acyl-sn-glycerol-3-phosphate acyltransferase
LHAKALQVAAGLQAALVQPGQAVAIMLPTSRDYFFSFLGVLLAGAIPVPMYPPPRLSQLEEHLRRCVAILNNCAAPVLITVAEGKVHAKLLRTLVGGLSRVVTVDDLAASGGRFAQQPISPQDIAFLQYTSGSTGTPKGVVLSHANLLANIRAMGKAVGATPDDVFVSWLPLYHDMGLIGAWLGSLYHAMPLVVMPPLSFISRPQRWLQAIHRYRGTLSAAPNFGYETCLRRLEDKDLAGLDLSSWRAAFNGAEAVSPETVERFGERFKPYGFKPEAMMPVYGLAESSVGLAFPPLGRGPLIDRIQRDAFSRMGHAIQAAATDANALRFVACGLPLAGHQIRVVDDAGRELPECRLGRVEFRGPSSTSGYFRDSEHTRALFHGDWLNTGDLGYMVGGELYVTGRVKDLIIRAGRNLYPQEIEQAVSAVEGVRKDGVAVFGSVDAATGTERLIVLAESRRLEAAQAEALRATIQTVVTDLLGEPPDDIVLAAPGAVLKTSSGKVRRSAIRELYERGDIGKTRRSSWLPYADLLLKNLWDAPGRFWLKTRAWGFAGYSWGVFGLAALLVWTAAMVLPSPVSRWRFMRASIGLMRRATGTPLTVYGLENLPPEGRPFVLVINHSSYLDVYAITAAIPRHFGFVAKEELARDRLLAPALRRIGTQFVERFDTEKSVADAKKLVGCLRQGQPLAYFPEGGFSRRPGLLPFHLGAFAAALETEVPIIPVALRGTRSMLRADTWFPRPGIISVTLGKPILPSQIRQENGGDTWQTMIKLRELCREHILHYVGEPDFGQD